MHADDDATRPYRPPAPSAGESPTKVCPDCMRDPEHYAEGGVRPIDEFRVITGKAAKNYANGQRRAAYCTYHERMRNAQYREAKRAELRSRPLTPEEEATKAREFARLERLRHAKMRGARTRRKAYRSRVAADPKRLARRKEREKQWEVAHVAERKAYKANWFQRKVDEAIAAGLRPPRKFRRVRIDEPDEGQTPD